MQRIQRSGQDVHYTWNAKQIRAKWATLKQLYRIEVDARRHRSGDGAEDRDHQPFRYTEEFDPFYLHHADITPLPGYESAVSSKGGPSEKAKQHSTERSDEEEEVPDTEEESEDEEVPVWNCDTPEMRGT